MFRLGAMHASFRCGPKGADASFKFVGLSRLTVHEVQRENQAPATSGVFPIIPTRFYRSAGRPIATLVRDCAEPLDPLGISIASTTGGARAFHACRHLQLRLAMSSGSYQRHFPAIDDGASVHASRADGQTPQKLSDDGSSLANCYEFVPRHGGEADRGIGLHGMDGTKEYSEVCQISRSRTDSNFHLGT